LAWKLFDTLRLTEVIGSSFLMIQSQRFTAELELADDAPPWPEHDDDDDDPERLTPADATNPPKQNCFVPPDCGATAAPEVFAGL